MFVIDIINVIVIQKGAHKYIDMVCPFFTLFRFPLIWPVQGHTGIVHSLHHDIDSEYELFWDKENQEKN